jgi:hypothetical protein
MADLKAAEARSKVETKLPWNQEYFEMEKVRRR